MPNANTVSQAMTASGLLGFPSDDLGNATTETQFSKSSSHYLLTIRAGSKYSNRPIRIKAWGRVTGGTAGNFTVNIDYGTSDTFSSNTTIASTGALADGGVSGNFFLNWEGIWDSTSGKLQGRLFGHVNATMVTAAIGTDVTVPGSTVLPTGTTDLQFTCNGLFSATNAGNHAYLDGFELEAL